MSESESDQYGWLYSIGNFIFNSLSLSIILFSVVLLMLYFFQNKLLYMPVLGDQPRSPSQNPKGYRNPSDRQLEYENIKISTSDGQILKGWICKQPNSQDVPTIVYFHENAGNIGTRVFFMEYYYNQLRVNIILVAYRGFSDSTGSPNEQGLQIDAESIMNHVQSRTDINLQKIFLHGRSLGGAVAAYVASQTITPQIAGVILENTFTSISDMVDLIFPKIRWFKRFIQRNFWPTVDRVPFIKVPLLFIISMQDEIVPSKQMLILSNQAKLSPLVEKFVMPDGTHNANWAQDPKQYFQRIGSFLNNAISLQKTQQN